MSRKREKLSFQLFLGWKKYENNFECKLNGTIFNKLTQILAYADDIDIIGRSQAAVRDALQREANKVGLKINENKTKYMIAAGTDRRIRDVGRSVAFGYKTFEVIKEFVYLGSLVTPNNDVSLEIQRRI